jgi:hypothetical protein
VYKPHEVVVARDRGIWVSSNERGEEDQFRGGITVFSINDDSVLSNIVIDEPQFDAVTAPNGYDYPTEVDAEGTVPVRDPNAPPFIQTVMLPIVLPPGSTLAQREPGLTFGTDAGGRAVVYAPMGAEAHPRHPHGVDIDHAQGIVYLLIEHAGLRWNADRTDFEIAKTTDEESGFILAIDVNDPTHPRIVDGYLDGHGAHELAVNDNNGWVFQGNHEDSPGVNPPNWVDVIDPTRENPYGFIDTGYYNAVQGIEVDESLNVVYGVTHVGQVMFAFRADTWPEANAVPTDDRKVGENDILYTVDIRTPFDQQIADAAEIWAIAAQLDALNPDELPSVLHYHDLTVDPVSHRAYMTLHSIHHAEHTGLPTEVHKDDVEEDDSEHAHFMGRWVAEVDVNPNDPTFQQVTMIDLSNGVSAVKVPNIDSPGASLLGLTPSGGYENWFVHAHWVAVDPTRHKVFVTGEHTGNLAVVDQASRAIQQVIPISLHMPGTAPETEPHVHGVQFDAATGRLYVSDEGTHSSYESVTILDFK